MYECFCWWLINIYKTLDLHQRITDKIEKINLRSKERMQEVNQYIIRKISSSIFISGLPACLNPAPDSRLTSIVKVVRLIKPFLS